MVFSSRPSLLELPESLRFVSMQGAQVPWDVALARPILDIVTSVTPLAPGFVVQLLGAEGHSGAIDSELAFRAEKVNALWWGSCTFSAVL